MKLTERETAVEWLEDKIGSYDFNQGLAQMRKYILQAKDIEEGDIKLAYHNGVVDGINHKPVRHYYKEKYGK
jgi:uncharacterized protein (DUF2164 family)